MLSDAPFTSPWSSEVFITGDYKLPVVRDSDDDDDILDLYKSTYRVDNQSHVDCTSGSTYMNTGSDCSNDDLYIDGDDDAFVFDIEADGYLQGLESNLNDFIDSTCNVNWSDDDDEDDDISSISSSSSSNTSVQSSSDKDWLSNSVPLASQAFTCSTLPSSKCQSRRLKNTPCKKWSHMTKSQKAKTVDELSLRISNELDIREQMEIIKVINPLATFNKQKSEFVIDLNSIDDVKLEKIQDIVNFHCVQSHDVTDNHSSPRKFSKKSKSQDRKPKVPKQRVKKENRQKLKEKRSGLFVKEERLAVSETIMEEDIDILG